MASLLYLKHAFNLSDEEVVERWSENVVWQYFSGQVYYEPRFPCDATQLGRFRRVIGEAGVEELLKATVETAVATKAVRPTEFERVIVDTTVQEKAIAHPVDSRLLEIARAKVVKAAKPAGIELKQTFAKEGKALRRKAGGIALSQAVQTAAAGGQAPAYCARYRAARDPAQAGHGQHRVAGDVGPTEYLAGARRAHPHPETKDKNKLYALHAAEVECIGKGKARKPYEFGVKTSIAVTHRSGLMVGVRTFPGNPYDGHTLAAQLEQTNILLEDVGRMPKQVMVDLG